MKRLFITGGSGYLGAELVRQAVGVWDVVITHHANPPTQPIGQSVQSYQLDLRDQRATEQLLLDIQPDVVIHTAYIQSGPDLRAITTEGSDVIARTSRRLGARLIHMSSDAVFDGEKIGSYTEADPAAPVSEYGRAKAEAERRVALAHPEALLVRTSLIYGGGRPSVHEQLIYNVIDGRADIAFFIDELRCPIQVADLASALLELTEHGQRGILHVAGAETLSRFAFAQQVAQAAGKDTGHLRSARSADSPVRRARNCAMDCSLAQSILRTRLRGVREALAH